MESGNFATPSNSLNSFKLPALRKRFLTLKIDENDMDKVKTCLFKNGKFIFIFDI